MTANFAGEYRDIDIQATITLRTGRQFKVDSDDIYSYRRDVSCTAGGLPLGEAVAATYTMGLTKTACPYTSDDLDNAEVRVRIGCRNSSNDAYIYDDAGLWYVTAASAPEVGATVTLNGSDALNLYFDNLYADDDNIYPARMSDLLEIVAAIAGVPVISTGWLNADTVIAKAPRWPEKTTLRGVVGYIAACAGGFAQIDPSGNLTITTNGRGQAETVTSDRYISYVPTGGTKFEFNCLRVTMLPEAEDEAYPEPVRFAIDANIADAASNCIEISGNPLYNDAIAASVRDAFDGLSYSGATLSWLGSPEVSVGWQLNLTSLDGSKHVLFVTNNQLTFDGGLTVMSTSVMPTTHQPSGHYSSAGRVFNSDGTLPATRVENFGGNVINAMLGKFDRIVAGSIETDEFFAKMGKVVFLQVDRFEAGSVDADIIKARSITAEQIKTNTITANSGVIAKGAIGTAQIADGSITSAKVVDLNADVIKTGTLSAERLLLVGDDGVIYKINAASSGLSLTELSKDQYKHYINGTVIVAKSITAAQIAARTITSNEILAGTITAKEINVSDLFASQATINALNAMDISGNKYLKLMVDNVNVGGTQLLRDTQQLTVGTDVDRWRVSGCEIIPAEDEFNAIRLNRAGLTENGWTVAMSPLTRLQDGWADRELTLSAWVYSPNWAAVDANMTWMVALSPGTASWPVYWAKVINVPGKVELNSAATSNAPLVNNKWVRVSVKFQMSSASFAGGGVFADCTHMHVQFRLNKNGDVRIYAPKLEFGNKTTDWSPYPEEFRAGSNVLITKDEVKISTPEFNVDIVGADGETNMLSIDENGAQMRSLTAPDVAPRYAGPATLYVNPAATSAQIAAGSYYRSLADALAALSNRWVGYDVTVNLAAGMTEYGRCALSGTAGKGVIYIRGNASKRAKLVGGLNVHFSGCAAVISNVNIDTGSGASAVDCAGNQTFVILESCRLAGAGTESSPNGVWARQGATVDVHGCEIYDFHAAVKAEQTGAVQIYGCKGNCYIRNNMGTIYATGSMPSGGTTFDAEVWGGALHTDGITVDQGSKPTVTPVPTTSTVPANATRSYTNAWRQSDTEIRQGYYSGMGEWAGCMWFPTASFSGKTIKTASLTLTRQKGSGKGSAVSLKLHGIKIASASGNPLTNAVDYGVIGTIENGETKTFTLPTAAGQALANGTIKGFMLYANDGGVMAGKNYSANYCKITNTLNNSNVLGLSVSY